MAAFAEGERRWARESVRELTSALLYCMSSRAGTSLASFIVDEKRRAEKKLKFSGHIVYIYSFDILQEGTKKGGSRKVSAICSCWRICGYFFRKINAKAGFHLPSAGTRRQHDRAIVSANVQFFRFCDDYSPLLTIPKRRRLPAYIRKLIESGILRIILLCRVFLHARKSTVVGFAPAAPA